MSNLQQLSEEDLTEEEISNALNDSFAQTLYDRFSDDDELASKLNEILDTSIFTSELVSRARERFHDRPQLGGTVDRKEASPTKHVIRNKAKQLNKFEAVAEILDNIFDNYKRVGEASDQTRAEKLNIDINFYPPTQGASGELVVKENSGGISEDRIMPLVQLGLSKRANEGIGAWGEGFKIASFALGSEIEVFSQYPGEEPIGVHFPSGWLEPGTSLWESWDVETHSVESNPPEEGSTFIRVNDLNEDILDSLGLTEESTNDSEGACAELADYFAEVYAEKVHGLRNDGYSVSLTISVADASREVEFNKPVQERLISNLAFIPWLNPIKWTQTFEAEVEDPSRPDGRRTATLQAEIYAGLFAHFDYSDFYTSNDPGVEMWGNGRLFSLRGRIQDESVGWGYKFGGRGGTNPEANASSRRIGVVVLFEAEDSRDIPWAAPVKHDYNRRSEFYAEIQQSCARVIRLYKNATSIIDSILEPFSQKWSSMSDEEKVSVLFKDADPSDEFIDNFKSSKFGSRVIEYEPDTSFNKLDSSADNVTPNKVHGVKTTVIKDVVEAASKSKNEPESVVRYLKAIFPSLARKSEIENKLNIEKDETIDYE
jgi:hypothetical protein